MKYIICSAIITALITTSCVKDPVACIDASSTNVEVYEDIVLNNCSEEAESFKWTIEDEFNQDQTTEESPTFSWSEPGVYKVKLEALSKKEKKSDEATENITVVDACYTCIRETSFGTYTEVICASQSQNEQDFENMKKSLESNDYECTKNP